jgi:hypothetical protein
MNETREPHEFVPVTQDELTQVEGGFSLRKAFHKVVHAIRKAVDKLDDALHRCK